MYTEDFAEDLDESLTPDERKILGKLKSSSAGWRKKLVREMQSSGAGEGRSRSSVRPRSLRWAWIPATTAACAFLAWITLRTPNDLQSAQEMVSAVYGERRTTEMRLTSVPYARYDPLPVERGAENESESRLQRPNFIDAEGAVAKRQQKGSLDAKWLEVKGRLALLAGSPNGPSKAVAEFQKAQSSGLEAISLQIDLAAAFYEQDIRSDHPNLQQSLDILLQVLKNPKLTPQERSVALFDLAVVYEKTQALDMAVSTWEQFLQGDPDSPWAQEGKQRLESAKAKIRNQQQRAPEKPLSPSSLLRAPPDGVVLENVEQYQDVALRRWLELGLTEDQSDYAKALAALATLLADKHAEFWLKDFLKVTSRQDADAAIHLQSSIESNSQGLYKDALAHATLAEKLFAARHNEPGVLRAQYERIYAFARSLTSRPCTGLADLLLPKLNSLRYPWLRSQLLLERAICENHAGNLAASDADLRTSLTTSQTALFPALELRVTGITASLRRQQGKGDEAWRQSVQGLEHYWQSPPFPDRLYQFYAGMELTAQEGGLTRAAEALGRQAISILEGGNDNVQLGAAHLLLADILIGEREDVLAEVEVRKADSLLATAPNEPTANRYKLIGKVRLARFQLERGEPQAALASLESARELLGSTQAYFVTLAFSIAEGDSYQELNRLSEAATSYYSAIKIAENALATLRNETSRLKWIRESDGGYRGLVRVLLKQDKTDEALQQWEWYRSRSPLNTAANGYLETTKDPSWGQIKSTAQPGEVRFVYAVFKDGIEVWATNSSGTTATWVPLRETELRKMAEDLSEKCSTPDSPLADVETAARKLFAVAVQPVAAELDGAKTVVIETDGLLSNLPLEALLSPQGWYFGQKFSLVYSPGVLQEKRLRRPAQVGANLRILLVDSANLSGAGYLPGQSRENDAILRLFPQTRAVDPIRTSWGSVQRALSISGALHFIGHGTRGPSGSGLLAGREKPAITAADFPPRFLHRLRLAVLSACSTGSTNDDGLLDTNSLVHSFMAAGVPDVLASRWNVDSETTALLMGRFYAHLRNQEPAAQAIQAARQELLAAKIHPYYWAGFSLSGRAH